MNNRDLLENQNGINGIEVITDTALHTPPSGQIFTGIVVATATVIASIVPAHTGNSLAGLTLPVNFKVDFPFTAITLTSGTIVVKKGV
jgi:hypothetical protein